MKLELKILWLWMPGGVGGGGGGWEHSTNQNHWQNASSPCTNNFFFEFDKGVCTVRKLEDTPDSEAWSVNMCSNLEECRKGVLAQLFGPEQISKIILTSSSFPDTQATTCHKRKFFR